jgi:hypothetical protein
MKSPPGSTRSLPADIVKGEFGEPAATRHKLVITDIAVDPEGRLGGAVAIKFAERDGKGRARRRRPPDVEFDETLLRELAARRIPFGVTKACIAVAVAVARGRGKTISPNTAHWRVAELLRRSREK